MGVSAPSTFDAEVVICAGAKQRMLARDECSSCYIEVGDSVVSAWDGRAKI